MQLPPSARRPSTACFGQCPARSEPKQMVLDDKNHKFSLFTWFSVQSSSTANKRSKTNAIDFA